MAFSAGKKMRVMDSRPESSANHRCVSEHCQTRTTTQLKLAENTVPWTDEQINACYFERLSFGIVTQHYHSAR